MSSSCGCGPTEDVDESVIIERVSVMIQRLEVARDSKSSSLIDNTFTNACVALSDDDASGMQAVMTIASFFDQLAINQSNEQDSSSRSATEILKHLNAQSVQSLMLDTCIQLLTWNCMGKALALAVDDCEGDIERLITHIMDPVKAGQFAESINRKIKFFNSFPGNMPLSLMKSMNPIDASNSM